MIAMANPPRNGTAMIPSSVIPMFAVTFLR